jgi:protein-L-isoaspartate O-methyltransferase
MPLLSPRVAAAFLAVPRHPFMPWREALESGEPPLAEAEMLDALDVRPGLRILEVGTGSGYGTALLCRLAGPGGVTGTDAETVEPARERLGCVGYRPVLDVAEPAEGCPRRAPFDRIVSNLAVPRVPAAWLAQSAPGALLVVPVAGALARLEVAGDGTAAGRLLHEPLPLRPHVATPSPCDWPGIERRTELPAQVLDDRAFAFFARLHLPDTAAHEADGHTGHTLTATDGSQASVVGHTVTVTGQRDLWSAVERAHTLWMALRRPRREWFEIRVTAQRQWISYRAPDGAEWQWTL